MSEYILFCPTREFKFELTKVEGGKTKVSYHTRSELQKMGDKYEEAASRAIQSLQPEEVLEEPVKETCTPWLRNYMAFCRLITELEAVGALNVEVYDKLISQTSLTIEEINSTINKAQLAFMRGKV